jgi:hypothetical protein
MAGASASSRHDDRAIGSCGVAFEHTAENEKELRQMPELDFPNDRSSSG